jgi:hypothetical protein
MAVHAKFSPQVGASIEMKDIAGYRIATFFHPTNGVQDNFYIYIHELVSAEDDLSSLSVSSAQPGKIEGTLVIVDDAQERNYSFRNINILTIESYFTQEQKTRIVIFQYRAAITNKGNYCTLTNTTKAQDPLKAPTKMGRTYAYRIDGTPEPLLFFGSRLSRNSVEIFRLGATRNSNNSFLDLVMRMDREIHPGKMSPRIIIVKGQNITLNATTLQGIIVDESYGSFLTFDVNSLDTIALTPDSPHPDIPSIQSYIDLIKIDFRTFNPDKYLSHSQNPGGIKRPSVQSSVETATIILKSGEELEKSPLIV